MQRLDRGAAKEDTAVFGIAQDENGDYTAHAGLDVGVDEDGR